MKMNNCETLLFLLHCHTINLFWDQQTNFKSTFVDPCMSKKCPFWIPLTVWTYLNQISESKFQILIEWLLYSPPSVSCQTIPSKVTLVPGSQGPRQSGSVMVPMLVPMHTSETSYNKQCKLWLAGYNY